MQNFSLSYPRYALRFIELKTRPLTQVEGGFFVLLEKKQAAIPTFFAPVHVEPFQPKGEKRDGENRQFLPGARFQFTD